VIATLSASPSDAVLFALLTLKDTQFAWNLAHSLGLDDDRTWSELVKAYEKVDPLAVLPIHARLVENELPEAGRCTTGSQHAVWRRCASSLLGATRPPRSTTSSPV
jgi:hypothetical protein